MTHLDKTYCASPNCVNACGRKMTRELEEWLDRTVSNTHCVSYGYFCGEPKLIPTDINEDLMPTATITICDEGL